MLKKSLIAFTIFPCAASSSLAIAPEDPVINQVSSVAPDVWTAYQMVSNSLRRKDELLITNELQSLNKREADAPPTTNQVGFAANPAKDWFSSAEGKRVLSNILSFQTPSGGWSTKTDIATTPRRPGQSFGANENYTPTFTDGATVIQLNLLAKAYHATNNERYLEPFSRGLALIHSAQYPNGCWPQTFPLRGGAQDQITFSDGGMINVMRLVRQVAQAENEFSFVTSVQQEAANESLERALDCVLKTQVVVNNQPTVWAAQYDPKSLQPAKPQNEQANFPAGKESAAIASFLMEWKNPTPGIVKAVHSAANWHRQDKASGNFWPNNAYQEWAARYQPLKSKP